jgi:hypothetical protein
MSLALTVTRGYGNGSLVGSIADITRMGYGTAEAAESLPGNVAISASGSDSAISVSGSDVTIGAAGSSVSVQ